MSEVAIELEPEAEAFLMNEEEKIRQTFLSAGMQLVKFSPEDEEEYLNMAYEARWDRLEGQIGPELTATLREMLTR